MSENNDNSPSGNPPKDPAVMRSVLKNVHAANLSREAGRHRTGLGEQEPLHLTSFNSPLLARDFQRLLSREGIRSASRRVRELICIDVDVEDRWRANELLKTFRSHHPDPPDLRRSQRFDFAILFAVVGFTVGIALTLGAVNSIFGMIRIALVALVCALLGHLVDRLSVRGPRGLFAFGVYEFLILAMIPALVVVISRIAPGLVFK